MATNDAFEKMNILKSGKGNGTGRRLGCGHCGIRISRWSDGLNGR